MKFKTKFCWVSHESKNGWSLGFSVNEKDYFIPGLYLESKEDVKRAIKGNIVFVHEEKSYEFGPLQSLAKMARRSGRNHS